MHNSFKTLGVITLGLFMAGCGAQSHYVLKPSSRPLSTFRTFEVKGFTIAPSVQNLLAADKRIEANTLVSEIAPVVATDLQGKGMISSTAAPDRLVIEGMVTGYEPGNQALRYLIGFGVGSSKVVTEVQFKDAQGNVIGTAGFEGGVSAGMLGGDKSAEISRLATEITNYITKSDSKS